MRLTLTAEDFAGPNRWYWRLKDGDRLLADHEVKLDPGHWQYEAYLDLSGYLKVHASPDRWVEDQRRIIGELSQWMGDKLLGKPIGDAIAAAAQSTPVTVCVTVTHPADAPAAELSGDDPTVDQHILFRPLELAHAGGRPLALQDVSLVFDTRGAAGVTASAAAESEAGAGPSTLRMLAVFSLPLGVAALNLRHERHQLRQIIRAIAADNGFALDLRVLQYGVTRAALEKMLAEGDGWDVLHFSGHGLASQLILEREDGSPDFVATPDLLKLLRPARGRLRWVTLSSCLSAAATAAETLRWLGLEPHRQRDPSGAAAEEDDPTGEAVEPADDTVRMPVLASTLADHLDCAVLAMRFPVGDRFAIDLGKSVYEGVLGQRQTLHRAVQLTLPKLCGGGRAPSSYPPLSLGTPALFGRRALDLSIRPAAKTEPDFSPPQTGLADFPRPEPRLVGRVDELTRASRALASRGAHGGVLFHGMAGAGKTACAVELAWQHEDVPRFQAYVWFKAPDAGKDISRALTDFAAAMERQLPRFQMVHLVDDAAALNDFLPRLVEVLRRNSILMVLDNLESLLRQSSRHTPQWRDPRWAGVIDALLAHDGESRVVLTSRVVPPIGQSEFARTHPVAARHRPADRLLTLAVHSLRLDEAALLARQLPNLRAILEGEHAADGFEQETHRELVRRMLHLVQGHPKLMELAEGQAADAATLAAHLDRAQSAQLTGDAPLAAFFEQGRSTLDEDHFLATLTAWTTAAVAALDDDARRLFEFLCCVEEADRTEQIVITTWEHYLRRRSQGESVPGESGERTDTEAMPPDREAEPRDAVGSQAEPGNQGEAEPAEPGNQGRVAESLEPVLNTLLAAGLVELRTEGEDRRQYGIHPGVAEAGRQLTGDQVQTAVDAELAEYWKAVFSHGIETEMESGGALIRVAGMRAAPYLIRRQRWGEASTLLERVLHQDKSPATVAALLPLFRGIAHATAGSERGLIDAGILANALLAAGRWQEAEAMMLDVAERAQGQAAWRIASGILGSVVNIMRATGRAEAALAVVERMKQATRNAGLGPWTQLGNDVWRLQLLNELGRYDEVLAEVERLRPTLADLPERSDQEESLVPWHVRETLLDTGRNATLVLGQWEECLALNADVLASQRDRHASELEQASTRYNDYGPLLSLRRWDDARQLLLDCRGVFEGHNHIEMLGKTFSALADLEDDLGHDDRAVEAEHNALRYNYPVGDPGDCAISHFNLAHYLRLGQAPGHDETALAHRLAAMLVWAQIGSGYFRTNLHVLTRELSTLESTSPAARLAAPDGSGFAAVVEIVERIDGVRFAQLFESLPTERAATGPEALAQVLAMASEEPGGK
ncbi:MAG: hypothetical protein ACYTG0_09800 [Planctomycetota bacterium]|jgi:tetratricopeptide (TPR) repeat protein